MGKAEALKKLLDQQAELARHAREEYDGLLGEDVFAENQLLKERVSDLEARFAIPPLPPAVSPSGSWTCTPPWGCACC